MLDPLTNFIRLQIEFLEDPVLAALNWSADILAKVSGRITLSDYNRIREELIEGMKRAKASDAQIKAALGEFEKQVESVGGTVTSNPPFSWEGLMKWAWAAVVAVAVIWIIATGVGRRA